MDRSQWETDFPISKYLGQKASAQGIPLHGIFELTSRCNFKCRMCYIHSEEDNRLNEQRELTAEQWIEIGRKAKDRGLLFLLLTGGEAMIRKDFLEIYISLVKMGIRVAINSNGSLLNEEILECFTKYPPARINLSLYGGSDETYQKLCGVRAGKTVRDAILRLKHAGIPIRIMMTFTPYNRQDMEQVAAFAKEHGIEFKGSAYMFPPVRMTGKKENAQSVRMSAEDAGRFTVKYQKEIYSEEVYKRMAAKNTEDSCTAKQWPEQGTMCMAGHTAFWITWDGKMKACGLMNKPEVDLKEKGFDEAWDEIRVETAKLRMPKECANCSIRGICHVCPAMCQAESGKSDEKPEYICRMAQIIHEEYALSAEREMEN